MGSVAWISSLSEITHSYVPYVSSLRLRKIPGGDILVVPLAPSRHGDVHKARPIGVYRAGEFLARRYLDER